MIVVDHACPQPPALTSLLSVARAQARRHGLPHHDAEDCALTFAETVLLSPPASAIHRLPASKQAAWLNRCASNHTANYRRTRQRLLARELTLLTRLDADGTMCEWEIISPEPACEARMFRQEFHAYITRALTQLTFDQRYLIKAVYFDERTPSEIAAASGKTPDAVRKALQRALVQLKRVLERQGITEAELRDCLRLLKGES